MRLAKISTSGFLIAALVAAPLSSASAGWHLHRGGGHSRGLFGVAAAVGIAALAVHAAPLAIIAGIASSGALSAGSQSETDEGPPSGYVGDPQRYADYGPPRGYSQPRNYSADRYYGNQPGYYNEPSPREYYPQQQARNYPQRGYYDGQPPIGYVEGPAGYFPSPQNHYYSPSQYYGPPQGYYAPRSRYYAYPPGY